MGETRGGARLAQRQLREMRRNQQVGGLGATQAAFLSATARAARRRHFRVPSLRGSETPDGIAPALTHLRGQGRRGAGQTGLLEESHKESVAVVPTDRAELSGGSGGGGRVGVFLKCNGPRRKVLPRGSFSAAQAERGADVRICIAREPGGVRSPFGFPV